MKIALLLCIMGFYRDPFLLCAADGAKVTSNPGTSPPPPNLLSETRHFLDDASRHGGAAAPPEEEAETPYRVSRAAHSFADSREGVDDYSSLRAAHTVQRQHRFSHGLIGSKSEAKNKRYKLSSLRFREREEGLVSLMGADKRNRIMHFGKPAGRGQDATKGDVAADKGAGRGIIHLGKSLVGSDVAASSPSWARDPHTKPSSPSDVSERAHQDLHFGKRDGDVAYEYQGAEAYRFRMGGDADISGTSIVAGLGKPEMESTVRKKRFTSAPEWNDDIDDSQGQLISGLIGEHGYAGHITKGYSGLSGPLHLPHDYVGAQVQGNALARKLSRPLRSDRSLRALDSGKQGAKKKRLRSVRNKFPSIG